MSCAPPRTRSGMLEMIFEIAAPVLAAAIAGSSIVAVAQVPGSIPGSTPGSTLGPTRPSASNKLQMPAAGGATLDPPAGRASGPGAQRAASASGGQVVARVGDMDLKEENVRAFIAGLDAREQAALARDPMLLSQMVRSLLANQLVLKEALARHWDRRPDVAEQIQRVREATIVESYLRSVSQPPPDFPGEAAIQNVYDANKTAFLAPREFLIAQIYVALPANADKAIVDKASKKFADIQLKLRKPDADFAAIARTDSDAKEAAEHGGEIGWVSETRLRPEIKAQVIGLAKGAVADPVKLDDGWHIVKLVDTKAANMRPLSEVRDELAQRIRDEQATASRRTYLTELLKKNPPAINEIELARMLNAPERALPR